MPVSKLYVEGEIDERVLKATLSLLPNNPAIERKGSKDDIPHIVRREREAAPGINLVYLRDRDFDSEAVIPIPDQPERILHKGAVHGYRWQRHEIESYLLTPSLVEDAFGVSEARTHEALIQAAAVLRDYTAARWTMGQTKAACKNSGSLSTRFPGTGNFELPPDLSEATVLNWVEQGSSQLLTCYTTNLAPGVISERFTAWQAKLTALTPEEVLVWFSPKDLLASMSVWRMELSKKAAQPADFCHHLASWLERGNGLRFFHHVPEAKALADLLTT